MTTAQQSTQQRRRKTDMPIDDYCQKVIASEEMIKMHTDQIGEITRTLRGFNGTPGLITRVELWIEKSERAAQKSEKVGEKVDIALDELAAIAAAMKQYPGWPPAPAAPAAAPAAQEGKFLTKDWVLEKLTYVLLSGVVWFLLDILPKLVTHVGSPIISP